MKKVWVFATREYTKRAHATEGGESESYWKPRPEWGMYPSREAALRDWLPAVEAEPSLSTASLEHLRRMFKAPLYSDHTRLVRIEVPDDGLGDVVNFPDGEMLMLRRLVKEEQKWVKAMTTVGALVEVPPRTDRWGEPMVQPDDEKVGRVIVAAGDPAQGDKLLVEHLMEGAKVQRWYSALQLSPHDSRSGLVIPFPRRK